MPTFVISKDVCLGMTCWGASIGSYGEAKLELTDDEVAAIVALLNEKGTSDVEALGLEEALPEVYAKLEAANRKAACNAEEDHWLEEGWGNYDWGFDPDGARERAEKEFGYKFEYEEEEYMDEDGNLDEDAVEDAKNEDFLDWATAYKDSLPDEKRREFMRLFLDVDLDSVAYEVEIPEEILEMSEHDFEEEEDN